MISKIIQKEKERQDRYFKEKEEIKKNCKTLQRPAWIEGQIKSHKQSLINLKEYMEGTELDNQIQIDKDENKECPCFNCTNINQLQENIEELNKMIERYGK